MEVNGAQFLSIIIDSKTDWITSESQWTEFYLRILTLLPDQIDSFTMGDSSSVPLEIAEELLRSICFTLKIEINAKKCAIDALLSEDIKELFREGRAEIESEVKRGRKLLDAVTESSPKVKNISYSDTLRGLDLFFKKYDSRFFAHEIPASIDYQLCRNVSDKLLGIKYINEYLRLLHIENRFFSLFSTGAIESALSAHCPEYKVLLVNLYEPLAINALGLALAGGDIKNLEICFQNQDKLYNDFCGLEKEASVSKLKKAAEIVCGELGITDDEEFSYLEKTAVELYPRLYAALRSGSLKSIFPRKSLGKNVKHTLSYIDGKKMDDEELRSLIDEIKDCRHVTDKVDIIKREIRSLRDLIEILDICLWDNESISLFESLGVAELDLLYNFAFKREIERYSETGWEQNILKYYRNRKEDCKLK